MDDEKQCMSDSLGFPVGQATQVIQLGRLKFLAHFAFKIGQNGLPSTGQPMAKRATQTVNKGMLSGAITGLGIRKRRNTSRVIKRFRGPGHHKGTTDRFPLTKMRQCKDASVKKAISGRE